MLHDPDLGIVAPAQILIDEVASTRQIAWRVFWNLETLTFAHDFAAQPANTRRLESDFCELTFAGIRMSAIKKVGFLDNDYGFYHEDADFGFRLRDAGYTCAYLPNSQIEHWASSTVSSKPDKFKLNYLQKNKGLFAQKFLGRSVAHQLHKSDATNSWNIVNKHLHPYLRRYGLVGMGGDELIFSHPGNEPFGYLYTVWETTRLPESWLDFRDRYRVVLNPSAWNVNVFKNAGFDRVHHAPLGVESDVFEPWGPVQRLTDNKTFLWFASNQYRKGLDVMLEAWTRFYRLRSAAKLILMGVGILDSMPSPDIIRIWKNFRVAEYLENGISVYESMSRTDEGALATIYRSVDFTICSSRSEGFGFTIAESMACGTPAIFGNFSAMMEFSIPDALTIEGAPIAANYSDKGFWNVGDWWEPSVEQLVARLVDAHDMSTEQYRRLSEAGVRAVRTKFSWRTTSLSIRRALIAEDEGRSVAPRAMTFNSKGGAPKLPASDASQFPQRRAIRGIAVRSLRRTGLLLTFFAENLGHYGWRHAISASSRQLVAPYFQKRLEWVRTRIVHRLQWATKHGAASSKPLRRGVLFVGYAEGALGLGQAFRANLKAAQTTSLPFAIYPFKVGIETRLIGPFMPERYDKRQPWQINFIEVAPDQVPVVFRSIDPGLIDRSYNILRPWWELPKAPEEWRPYLENIHEIWAPNRFIAEAFAHIFDGPIVVVPAALEEVAGDYPGRSHYGMDERRFYFMFSFDYYSSPFRKNPLAVLKAFQQAFADNRQDVGLVIKSTGAPDHFPEIKALMEQAAKHDPRILMFDRNMNRDEMLGLIRASDAYVSLHRAEGFGLGMAEAMMFERAVIGTDYSGSTEFLTEETGFPVPYTLRAVEPHEYSHSKGQVWAEPDVGVAADIMRRVVVDRSERISRGRAAHMKVKLSYSPQAVGRAMEARFDALFEKLKASGARD